jgi:hypothetical protein
VEPDLAEDPLTPEVRHSPVPGPSWPPGPAPLSVLAGATMFRVAAFREVGGFSARLCFGGEEELLAIDLAARGWWMCWAEELLEKNTAACLAELAPPTMKMSVSAQSAASVAAEP